MAEEFYSFERALRELQMREEELKRLVSAGEIRAFRDGDQMKLRREDIERMRARKGGAGDIVDLGEEIPVVSEEEPGMATAQISEADTLLEEEAPVAEAIELPVEEALPAAAPAPARARTRAPAPVVEPGGEGMGMRLCLVATTVLLVLAGFVAYGASNVEASGIAGGIASMVKGAFE
ncbi:MAG TPA: hypothetical protein VFI25_08700 [Planctomycetota bacterium]|nr:hypothetical protein [Planctomycetota bacterium]